MGAEIRGFSPTKHCSISCHAFLEFGGWDLASQGLQVLGFLLGRWVVTALILERRNHRQKLGKSLGFRVAGLPPIKGLEFHVVVTSVVTCGAGNIRGPHCNRNPKKGTILMTTY